MVRIVYDAAGKPVKVPPLQDIAQARPEFASGPRIWDETLAPALQARESDRRETLRRAWRKTFVAALIPGLLLVVGGIAMPFLLGGWMLILFFGVPLSVILIAGMDWLNIYAMKNATKELVLSAACQCFGFTYDTLAPDIARVTDFRSLVAAGKAYNAKYGSPGAKPGTKNRKRGAQTRITTPFGSASFGASNATGPECPTPAYEALEAASLLPAHDSRHFEDLIKGERAGAAFSLVEAKLETTGDNGGTVFQGLLFHVDYPQRFLGRTLMARSRWWKRGKAAKALKKVSLVSAELDKAFTVYSTDQVEARALLTPDRMERLIALERHFSAGKLRGLFEDGHMTLALEAPNQFEAGSIFKPLVNPDRFTTALIELGLVCDMIDGFLTRDWVQDKL
ncbi:DUF3137 domain-containing protein [Hyphomonas johnsonii]|uniref:Galanin n=1 Tax=Hyphomonas johnsonii MHS-2 TaxID=1280950 RepID=A0A059FUT2_9PROT|nr:DUF3137 domain-containing protein [Hyphomonas johnsonii]KCZ94445.1 hypothetical protein HJO_03685 [Hyphomonas johnsonii MHS-2]